MGKKYLFYLRGQSRAILITDQDETRPASVVSEELSNSLEDNTFCEFSTKNDSIIIRTSSIDSIHIQETSKSSDKTTIDIDLDLGEDYNISNDIIDSITSPIKLENNPIKDLQLDEIPQIQIDDQDDPENVLSELDEYEEEISKVEDGDGDYDVMNIMNSVPNNINIDIEENNYKQPIIEEPPVVHEVKEKKKKSGGTLISKEIIPIRKG